MSDRSIIFSAPMVRALLDGRKMQTRRLVADAPEGAWHCDKSADGFRWVAEGGSPSMPCRVPFAAGDRAYVREAWRVHKSFDALPGSELEALAPRVWTEIDRDNCDAHGRYRHARFMPRWASRLTLFVDAVSVQRLQDITEPHAVAEGASEVRIGALPGIPDPIGYVHGQKLDYMVEAFNTARDSFRHLWDTLHAEPGTRWADNPWIYVLTFRVARGNIDQLVA